MPRVAVININDSHRCEAHILPPDLLCTPSLCRARVQVKQPHLAVRRAPRPRPTRSELLFARSHTYRCRFQAICRVSRNWTGQRPTKHRLYDRTRVPAFPYFPPVLSLSLELHARDYYHRHNVDQVRGVRVHVNFLKLPTVLECRVRCPGPRNRLSARRTLLTEH